jgi:hypothetical protein
MAPDVRRLHRKSPPAFREVSGDDHSPGAGLSGQIPKTFFSNKQKTENKFHLSTNLQSQTLPLSKLFTATENLLLNSQIPKCDNPSFSFFCL